MMWVRDIFRTAWCWCVGIVLMGGMIGGMILWEPAMKRLNERREPSRIMIDAAMDGDVGTLDRLLKGHRFTQDELRGALFMATRLGQRDTAELLLSAGVDANWPSERTPPLIAACSGGHADVVRLLLAHGADVNARDELDNTPLFRAAALAHHDCVAVLIEAGADVDGRCGIESRTPLMVAAAAGHEPVVRYLLQHGADPTQRDAAGATAEQIASASGHGTIRRTLQNAVARGS